METFLIIYYIISVIIMIGIVLVNGPDGVIAKILIVISAPISLPFLIGMMIGNSL